MMQRDPLPLPGPTDRDVVKLWPEVVIVQEAITSIPATVK